MVAGSPAGCTLTSVISSRLGSSTSYCFQMSFPGVEELSFVKKERGSINPVLFSKRPYGWQGTATVVRRKQERQQRVNYKPVQRAF